MDARTFLEKVTASKDNMVICVLNRQNGAFRNVYTSDDLDVITEKLLAADAYPGVEVYFSVGRFANNKVDKQVKRTKDLATWFKSFCLDQDIAGYYESKKAGAKALVAAATKIGLPPPMIVDSGNGLHYYWPLTDDISKDKWEQLSIALRWALEENGVVFDASKIHDPSMVLRPVGTHNKKTDPKPVKLLLDAGPYDVEVFEEVLKPWQGKAKQETKAKTSKILQAITENRNLVPEKLAKRCNQIRALLESGGATDAAGNEVKEPLWRASLGIARYCVDMPRAVEMLCSRHPEYDFEDNMRKLENWKAPPPTCEHFHQLCPSGCETCPYWGKIHSPVALNEDEVNVPETIIEVAKENGIDDFELPEGYFIYNGKIYEEVEVEKKDKNGNVTKEKERRLACPYEIHVVGIYADHGFNESTVKLAANHGLNGWKIHELPAAVLQAGGKDLQTWIGNKQLFIAANTTVDATRRYIMRYLEMVRQKIASGVDVTSFGWQDDHTFICGEDIRGDNLSRRVRLSGSAKLLAPYIKQSGDRDAWVETMKLVDTEKAEHIGVGVLAACSGVLGNVGGTSTLTYVFYSPRSGTGKTLALMAGSSTFMNPSEEYMLRPADTDNAIYNSLATYGDLSAALDEITIIDDDKRATDMAFRFSQGADKKRLNQNAVQKEVRTWRAPVRISTNKSLYDMFDAHMANSEPARLRTLEFDVSDPTFSDTYGKQFAEALKMNYGFAVPELAERIITLGGREKVWRWGVEEFRNKFKFTFDGKERYYEGACIACYIVGEIGRQLGLIPFSVERIIEYMLARIAYLRSAQQKVVRDVVDDIGQYLQERSNEVVLAREDRVTGKRFVAMPLPQKATARFEIISDNGVPCAKGSYLAISRNALKEWATRRRDSVSRIIGELNAMGALMDENHRLALYKGVPNANPATVRCVLIDITHPKFSQYFTHSAPAQRETAPTNVLSS